MTTEARRQFGAYLRRLRGHMSQSALATKLCTISGTSSVTRHEISRWERGQRIPDGWLAALSEAFNVPLVELDQAAASARGKRPTDHTNYPPSIESYLPEREGLWTPGRGRRVDHKTAEGLAARVHGLRLADDVLTGGDLIKPAMRELSKAVKLYQDTSHTEEVGRELLVAIGELGQIAGWIASDAGKHPEAERAYRLGLSAAREAEEHTLAGNLAGSLAYQLSNTGKEREGLSLAQAALAEAGPTAHPTTRALYFDRVAWAHTRLGEQQPALRALGEAHQALSAEHPDEAPKWAYWVSKEELQVMDARVYTELRRPLRAVPLLTQVLSRYDTTHAREVALYLSWLVVALADANEPEQAAAEARRMLDLSAGLSSDRTSQRSRIILSKLGQFTDVPEVAELLDGFPVESRKTRSAYPRRKCQ
ncbi:helix-turn-helix domain-containing protein [Kitasatospora sp. NPDC056651]|uniref:helix-turn-helix domain-containing protein n=1 Tax=Kitasatospora sp. NPDC056651 TaxID=3345892 RepID=UPI003685D2CA